MTSRSEPYLTRDGEVRYHTGFGVAMVAILGVSLAPTLAFAVVLPQARATMLISTSVVVLMLLGMYLSTHYTFGSATLRVRCGPITVDVPYDAIRRAAPSSSLMSGYAMSLERIEVEYGDGDTMLISPAARESFLEELRRRAPHADIRDRE